MKAYLVGKMQGTCCYLAGFPKNPNQYFSYNILVPLGVDMAGIPSRQHSERKHVSFYICDYYKNGDDYFSLPTKQF